MKKKGKPDIKIHRIVEDNPDITPSGLRIIKVDIERNPTYHPNVSFGMCGEFTYTVPEKLIFLWNLLAFDIYPNERELIERDIEYLEQYEPIEFKVDIERELKRIESKAKKLQFVEKSIINLQMESLEDSVALRSEELKVKFASLKGKKVEFLELIRKKINLLPEDDQAENIKTLNSISSKLVLLKELGVYDLLETRIKENTKSKTDLEKLVSYIIGENNPQSVGRYFHNMEIDQKPGGKYSPYTKKAIKEMERVMRDCNIKILGDYSKFTKTD